MIRTTLVTVPATIGGRPSTVTYRVTVVVDAGGSPAILGGLSAPRGACRNGIDLAAKDGFDVVRGYAEAVPVQVTAERQFDLVIDQSGGSSRTGDRYT